METGAVSYEDYEFSIAHLIEETGRLGNLIKALPGDETMALTNFKIEFARSIWRPITNYKRDRSVNKIYLELIDILDNGIPNVLDSLDHLLSKRNDLTIFRGKILRLRGLIQRTLTQIKTLWKMNANVSGQTVPQTTILHELIPTVGKIVYSCRKC